MKKFLQKKFVFGAAVFNSIFYCIGALGLYIHPKYFWGFTFCTLGFPILFIGLVFFFAIYLWVNKRRAVLIVIIICFGYKSFYYSFALNIPTTIDTGQSLKVMSWNVGNFNYLYEDSVAFINNRNKIIQSIKAENPDIVCIQDYFEMHDSRAFKNTLQIFTDSLGYNNFQIQNSFLSPVYNVVKQMTGTAVFSKLPIAAKGIITFSTDTVLLEGLNYMDVFFNEKKVRVITSHFKSLQLGLTGLNMKENYLPAYQDTNLAFKTSKIKKLFVYDTIHTIQAQATKQFLDSTQLPLVFCADLNSVPTSYTYNLLTKNLKDVFLEKSLGLGRTYYKISPTLRIDVMLVSKSVQVLNYNSPKLPYSDHYPIIATLKLP